MIKQEKEQYRKKKCLLQQQSLNHVLASKNRVKESKIQGKMKIQDFFNQKKEKFKNNYIHEMTEEENIKKRKENEILKMEKLEMDLISKLQSSQIMQKNAYEELQSALTLPAKEFEKRFLSEKNDNINENKEVKKNENEQKQTEEVINTENTKEDNS